MSDEKQQEAVESRCLVCGSISFCIKPIPKGWDIFKCGVCRLEFCDPMPSEEEFGDFYTDYSDPRAPEAVCQANAQRHIEALKEYGLTSESRLLDYGSGQGVFCRAGGSDSWVNYDLYTANSESRVLEDDSYDWVTMWGVLEHVADPVGLLGRLKELLREGGHIALTTVSTELTIPYQHKPPEHVTYWTRGALERALTQAGFSICQYKPYNDAI